MRHLIVDLETAPHPDAQQWANPVKPDAWLFEPIEPDSRLKDPVKVAANLADVERRRAERPNEIAANIAEKTAKQFDDFGLDLDCNRIVAQSTPSPGKSSALAVNSTNPKPRMSGCWKPTTADRRRSGSMSSIRPRCVIARSYGGGTNEAALSSAVLWQL